MPANSQPQTQSRWTAFVLRLDERFQRLEEAVNPFSGSAGRPIKTWAVCVLSIGLVVLAGMIGFGIVWIIDHHKWSLIVPLLKVIKAFGVGIAIVMAVLCWGKLPQIPWLQRLHGRGAAHPKE
jgi:hypothetical protein